MKIMMTARITMIAPTPMYMVRSSFLLLGGFLRGRREGPRQQADDTPEVCVHR
jgi:hypothetical protein